MKAPSLTARTAAVAAAVLVTLANVWLIASYAYPHAGAGARLVASHDAGR